MPVVSVVIPTYNHRAFVLQTLNSVFEQTFTDHEIIVVNDGSPDDTADVLRPLAEAGRIHYIEQANAGQSNARNRGIAEAKGEFIALLDDDDLWPPDKIAWQVELLQNHPEAVLVSGTVLGLTEVEVEAQRVSAVPQGWVKTEYLQKNYILSPGQTLIRSQALRNIGGCDPSIWGADDWELYIRLADKGTFISENRTALRYRRHSANASRDVPKMATNWRKVVRKHLGAYPSWSNYKLWRNAHHFINECKIELYVGMAREAMGNNNWQFAVRCWVSALICEPKNIRYGFYMGNLWSSIYNLFVQNLYKL